MGRAEKKIGRWIQKGSLERYSVIVYRHTDRSGAGCIRYAVRVLSHDGNRIDNFPRGLPSKLSREKRK